MRFFATQFVPSKVRRSLVGGLPGVDATSIIKYALAGGCYIEHGRCSRCGAIGIDRYLGLGERVAKDHHLPFLCVALVFLC